ncbi:MAG: DUF1189 domain-containing protein [Acidobacteria bacterium]|nr:MAG: DUF1189 domain-containing protein [Acidobacteriota bacterium]
MPLIFSHIHSFYSDAYSAVTDFQFYTEIGHQEWRRTLRFLLYLSAHVAVILSVTFAWHYSSEFRSFAAWAQNQFPALTVKNGELTVKAAQPLVRRYEGGLGLTFVFDTTGHFQSPDGFAQPAFLFTKRNLLLRYRGQTEIHAWEQIGSFELQRADIKTLENLIAWSYFPVSYSFFLVYTLFAKSLTALFLTGFAVAAAARYRTRMSFRSSFAIALYALTPAIVIGLAVNLTGLSISYFQIIYFGIGAVYTYMAAQKFVAPGSE